jgi:proteasome assembly chaperone (PAC2) family protein
MAESLDLKDPWLVAVWPGMGHVALTAGYYLLSKLDMSAFAEYEANELFDVERVEVKDGLIQAGSRPRNRFFIWRHPEGKHDLILFLGETQPPIGKYHFCRKLLDFAGEQHVERVFTFAAMATQMHPSNRARVFGAATENESLKELRRLELELLEDGLNGVLLGAAAEIGVRGACLLGEMPHVFHQLPFPKASLAILEVFATIAGIELDLEELSEQSRAMEQRLSELLEQMEQTYGRSILSGDEAPTSEAVEEEKPSDAEKERIESLFAQAQKDRSKAFELKQELDRLEVFKDYEDRFLDLFRRVE